MLSDVAAQSETRLTLLELTLLEEELTLLEKELTLLELTLLELTLLEKKLTLLLAQTRHLHTGPPRHIRTFQLVNR
jgi:hypothetical protein